MTLTKSGAGTQTLSGVNTYTGATTVSGGKLTIGTSGTINTAVSVLSGNTYTPGEVGTAGSQTFNDNLTLGTGSIFEWDLTTASTASGFDHVIGTSGKALNVAAATFRVFTDLDFSAGTFWKNQEQWSGIFSSFGTVTGWGANTAVSVYSTSGSLRDVSGDGAFSVNGTTLTWDYATVPEPGSALAGLLLGAGLLRRKRN